MAKKIIVLGFPAVWLCQRRNIISETLSRRADMGYKLFSVVYADGIIVYTLYKA